MYISQLDLVQKVENVVDLTWFLKHFFSCIENFESIAWPNLERPLKNNVEDETRSLP